MKFKVLIISHNCFSTYQNMGKTFKGLFSSFNKNQLYQLYFHSSYPDIDMCKSMFRITDMDVLNSLIHHKKECGAVVEKRQIIQGNNVLFDNSKAEQYHIAKTRKKYLIAMRDALWSFCKWNTKELNVWLDDFEPDVIYFAAGDAIFAYTIALSLSKRRNIPLVVMFFDDYYNYAQKTLSIFYHIQHCLLKRMIKKTIKYADKIIFVSPSFEDEYRRIFGKQGTVIMTPYQNKNDKLKKPEKPLIISYTGNISLKRWKTLRSIGEVLSRINTVEVKAILNVYSKVEEPEVERQINIANAMYYKGNISAEEVKNVIEKSDILVHVESFDSDMVDRVKHSVSTKIADYLASNRIILAVGPSTVASIAYLKYNDAAYIIEKEDTIEEGLRDIIYNISEYEYLVLNSTKLAIMNHCEKDNSKKFKDIIYKSINNT